MNIRDIYQSAVRSLQAAGIPDADLEVAFLLGRLLKMNRAQLLLAADDALPVDILQIFEDWLERRRRHEPHAYITGEQEFWSLPFLVNPAVLIPRQETELLIEKTLGIIRRSGPPPLKILDLGVGSGIISVVLAREIPGAQVFGVDLSFAALEIARANVSRHGVGDRVHLINADWLQCLRLKENFDLVVSNPPYIDPASFPALQPEVVAHEPHLALQGGDQGLSAIRKIVGDLHQTLRRGAWFFMEIGADQEDMVLDIFTASAKYENLTVYKDYAGLPRVLQARKI